MKRHNATVSTNWKRTVYIMFFAQLVTAVGFSSIFPFLPLYVQDLGSGLGWNLELLVGLVFSGQAVTMMIASPIWGALADRFGRKIMVERSLFGGALIILLMGFVGSAEQLVVLRVIQGLITGTVSAANALVAAEAPRQHAGYAMGLLQSGLFVGVSVGPILGGALADLFGYSEAFLVTAALLLLAGVMVVFGVREGAKPAQKSADSASPTFFQTWRIILSASGVRIAYGVRFLVMLGRVMIIPIAPLFIATLLASQQGVNTMTGLVIGAASAATTVGTMFLGRLGDRIGHRKVLIASVLFGALLYLPQSLVSSAWQLLALQACVGLSFGGVVPAISALLTNYTRAGDEGAVFGLDNSINSGARAVAPLAGTAVAFWFGLRATFVATAILFLLAAVLAFWRLPDPKSVEPVRVEAS